MLRTLIQELRRRRTFRTAGLYIVSAWLVMQAADLFFPAWGLPDAALNVLLVSAVLGFPVALIFGWYFDITEHGVVRTPPATADDQDAPLALRGKDYALLTALGVIVVVIGAGGLRDLVTTRTLDHDNQTVASNAGDTGNAIAVLPFANSTADRQNDAFCDGISEEILHKLAGVSGLRVIGRTSSFAFKGSDYSVSRIARSLGVQYLLQGSVRLDGDQLRVTASLVDSNGVQQWSQAFDRRMQGIFEIQAEIAEVVAATIAPTVAYEDTASYVPDPYVYQTFLAGRELLRKRGSGARELLEKTVRLDPEYAAAYAELAIAKMIGGAYSSAKSDIDTSMALNPGLPRALAARGLWLLESDARDDIRAEEFLNAALAAEPAMVDAMNWLGHVYATQGRDAEEFAIRQRAAQIDPLHGVLGMNLATMYGRRGRFDEAEQQMLRLLEVPIPAQNVYVSLRGFYHEQGRIADMAAIEKALAERKVHMYFGLAHAYALLGMWEESRYWIDRSIADHSTLPFIGYGLYASMITYWQGDYSASLLEFEQGLADNPGKAAAMQPSTTYFLGVRQALAGSFDESLATLEPVLSERPPLQNRWAMDATLALLWSYGMTGRSAEAQALGTQLEQFFDDAARPGKRLNSQEHYAHAVSGLLIGEESAALERLERAIAAGWRERIRIDHDRRWDPLRNDPRFVELMEIVATRLDEERRKVAAIETRVDFIADFERVHGPPG